MLQPVGLSLLSFRHDKHLGQLILKLQKASTCLPCSVWTLRGAVAHSLKLLTSLNYLIKARTLSHGNFFLLSVFVYFWREAWILNCLMACTVFAQTLMTRCCCVRSLWGSEPFCNFRLRSPNPFSSTLPLPSYFHHSCLLYSPHYCPSSSTPCDDDDVTLMPVSCSDCVLKICMSSVLACCTSVWSPGTIKKAC